jgi:hypothetical protein
MLTISRYVSDNTISNTSNSPTNSLATAANSYAFVLLFCLLVPVSKVIIIVIYYLFYLHVLMFSICIMRRLLAVCVMKYPSSIRLYLLHL